MSSNNLPPGVTESMIPGNRPEDVEYERFWERVTAKMKELGLPEEFPIRDADKWVDLIDWISGTSWTEGYNNGINDQQLSQLFKDQE